MTWAAFSIVANEVSPSGCSAYTYAQYSFDPYIRAPFFQFSEQMIDDFAENGGTHPAYPFLTGNGGANQVVLFGYLGLRLLPDFALHIDPNLPLQIPYLKYRTFYWRGWPITASSNYSHTTLQRAVNRQPLPSADPRFANSPIPVHVGPSASPRSLHELSPNSTLIVPNRQVGNIPSAKGNLIQCSARVTSQDDYEPGQFPISAIDGAASTKWQPSRASQSSSLTVQLPVSEVGGLIGGFAFDWGQLPPVSARVLLHDTVPSSLTTSDKDSDIPSPGFQIATSLSKVPLSNPYDPHTTNLNAITPYKGNTTNVTLPELLAARKYATLVINGNQALGEEETKAGNGKGASVAEWAILKAGS